MVLLLVLCRIGLLPKIDENIYMGIVGYKAIGYETWDFELGRAFVWEDLDLCCSSVIISGDCLHPVDITCP